MKNETCPSMQSSVYFSFLQVLHYHIPVMHSSQTVKHVECYKNFGIVLTHDPSWEIHYNIILFNASLTNVPNVGCDQAKKVLHLSLVKLKLTYSSPIRWPRFLKDILNVESIQHRATKYIIYSSDYKSQLIHFQLLPLLMQFELSDIMFIGDHAAFKTSVHCSTSCSMSPSLL